MDGPGLELFIMLAPRRVTGVDRIRDAAICDITLPYGKVVYDYLATW
jgi:hypothetical protein